ARPRHASAERGGPVQEGTAHCHTLCAGRAAEGGRRRRGRDPGQLFPLLPHTGQDPHQGPQHGRGARPRGRPVQGGAEPVAQGGVRTDIFRALAAPFPPDRVSWRVGSTTSDKSRGMALAYIDARDVMDRLDEVVGPGNWQCRYPHANGKTVCEIGINVAAGMAQVVDGHASTVERWVWKADGAGDTDVEAEKGAGSDAFKRAAVRWGIGR